MYVVVPEKVNMLLKEEINRVKKAPLLGIDLSSIFVQRHRRYM
jgi:hypothetical protein